LLRYSYPITRSQVKGSSALPAINLLAKKLKTKEHAQARARAEVKKALKEYQDALAAERSRAITPAASVSR
jgi:hypothetical protein